MKQKEVLISIVIFLVIIVIAIPFIFKIESKSSPLLDPPETPEDIAACNRLLFHCMDLDSRCNIATTNCEAWLPPLRWWNIDCWTLKEYCPDAEQCNNQWNSQCSESL